MPHCHNTNISRYCRYRSICNKHIDPFSLHHVSLLYHLRSEISKKRSNYLFRRYTGYAAFTLMLFLFVTIAHGWRTGNGKYTILVSGHCVAVAHPSYNTIAISSFVSVINKFLQVMMFLAYLVYLYKFNKNVCAAGVTLQHGQKLLRIAIAIGSTVDLSSFFYILLVIIQKLLSSLLVLSFSSNML